MNAADALIALAHFDPARRSSMDAIRKNPVRLAAVLVALVVIVVAALTGTPMVAVLAQVAAIVAAAEKVRSLVAPMLKVVLHEDEVNPGELIVAHGPDGADVLYDATEGEV